MDIGSMEDSKSKDTGMQEVAPGIVPVKKLRPLAPESFRVDELQAWSDRIPTSRRKLVIAAVAVLFVVFGIGGYWSATAPIGGAVVAGGRIIAEGNNRVVQNLEGGILKAVAVREGDAVKQGDLIAEVDDTATRSQLDTSSVELAIRRIELERWRAERLSPETFTVDPERMGAVLNNPKVKEALESQIAEYRATRDARLQQLALLDNKIASEEEDLGYLKEQLKSFDVQLDLITKEYNDLSQLLEKKLISQSRVLALQREISRIEAQKSSAVATAQKSHHNIRSFNDEKQRVVSESNAVTSQKITETQQKLNEIEDVTLRLQDRLDRSRIVAPVNGTVFRIPVKSIGAVIKPGETIAEILPKDETLQIEVPVLPNDIDKIFAGQEVNVVFSSDQTNVIPPLKGTVRYISADAAYNEAQRQSFYIVHVAMEANHHGRTILPGNVAEVFFKTTPRTFFQHLADPVTRFALKTFED